MAFWAKKKKKKIVQDSSAVKCKILGNSCQLQTYKTFNANAALLPMLKNKRFQYEIWFKLLALLNSDLFRRIINFKCPFWYEMALGM